MSSTPRVATLDAAARGIYDGTFPGAVVVTGPAVNRDDVLFPIEDDVCFSPREMDKIEALAAAEKTTPAKLVESWARDALGKIESIEGRRRAA